MNAQVICLEDAPAQREAPLTDQQVICLESALAPVDVSGGGHRRPSGEIAWPPPAWREKGAEKAYPGS